MIAFVIRRLLQSIVVMLTERVSDAHLAGLRDLSVVPEKAR